MPDTTDVLSNLKRAVSLHQSGKLQQAKNIYQQVLEMEPENTDALHLLGLSLKPVDNLSKLVLKRRLILDNWRDIKLACRFVLIDAI